MSHLITHKKCSAGLKPSAFPGSSLFSVELKWMFLHRAVTVTLTEVGPKCCLMLIIGWQHTGWDSFLRPNPPAEASQVGAAEFGDVGWVRHAERLFIFFFLSFLWRHRPFDLMPVNFPRWWHVFPSRPEKTSYLRATTALRLARLKVKPLRPQVMIRLVCSELMQNLQLWNVVAWT